MATDTQVWAATKTCDALLDRLGVEACIIGMFAALTVRQYDDEQALERLVDLMQQTIDTTKRSFPSAAASRKGVTDGSSQGPT